MQRLEELLLRSRSVQAREAFCRSKNYMSSWFCFPSLASLCIFFFVVCVFFSLKRMLMRDVSQFDQSGTSVRGL
jgi:hypothetical protein